MRMYLSVYTTVESLVVKVLHVRLMHVVSISTHVKVLQVILHILHLQPLHKQAKPWK